MREQYAWRSLTLAGILALVGLSIILQIARIQNSPEAATFRGRLAQTIETVRTFYPERGQIYDRNGHLLAGNTTVYEIGVDLKSIKDKHAIALAVGMELGLNPDNLYSLMATPPSNLEYLILANYVDSDKALALQQLKIKVDAQTPSGTQSSLSGLEFTPRPQRTYTEGALASNVIGFVSHEGRGYFGIEEKYNDILAVRHARALVPHTHHGLAVVARQGDLHGRFARRIADGVADHVLHGAAQQLRIALHRHRLALLVFQPAAVRRRFDRGIVHQLLHQLVQAQRVAAQRRGIAFGARHLEQLAHQRVEPVGFLLNAVQRGVEVVARARQLHRHAQARQRRAQLVRNVQQQPALGGQQGLDAVRHAVEGARQLAQFVAAGRSHARRKVAAPEPFHRLLQLAHGAGQVQRQPVAQQHRRGHHERCSGSRNQDPTRTARHDVEEPVAAVVGGARHGGIARAEELVERGPPRARAPGRSGPRWSAGRGPSRR